MHAVCERHFKDLVVFSVTIDTYRNAPPSGSHARAHQVHTCSLNLKVSGLDGTVASAPRTTEAISVWEKWSIPTPDGTGSAESGLCGSTTLVLFFVTHGNVMRSARERERPVLVKLAVSKAVN